MSSPTGTPIPLDLSQIGETGDAIYVIEFDSGILKVGFASKPRQRLETHDRAVRQMGGFITRAWVSPAHANARGNERALIKHCAERSARVTGAAQGEYFTDLRYEEVRTFAASLEMTPEQPAPPVRDRRRDCPACGDVDDRPLTAIGLLHQVAHGHLRIIDTSGRDVSDIWAGQGIAVCGK